MILCAIKLFQYTWPMLLVFVEQTFVNIAICIFHSSFSVELIVLKASFVNYAIRKYEFIDFLFLSMIILKTVFLAIFRCQNTISVLLITIKFTRILISTCMFKSAKARSQTFFECSYELFTISFRLDSKSVSFIALNYSFINSTIFPFYLTFEFSQTILELVMTFRTICLSQNTWSVH